MDKKDDDIVDLRARMQAANKPVMRVNRDELLANGGLFAERIPSFLAEIEKANRAVQQSSSTPGPDAPSSSGFELGENEARDQVHVEMDIVAGILEEKQQPVTHTRPPGSEDGSDDEFQLAMPPAGSVTGAGGDGSKPLQIRPAGSSASSEDSSGSDTSSSAGSPGRRACIVLEKTPTSRVATDAAAGGHPDSPSSTTSSSGSSTSSSSSDAADQDSAQALSPSLNARLAARKRTQSPASASPAVDSKCLGLSSPAAVEDPPKKKKKKTKKLIEEVE
ncbi:hypothetical protein PpBr36_01584 [Pyricularia pennisetigena]|uniref:hypothetical protein n=1 Tax=Pyricularia pennisetigena TaxID=1578925 RepID=UPI0011510F07|nr:hypothetical protein PpBr36_01584 [Pyricularia pennisetigena]TLS28908.1 hypothetical protein PpBr36_01584 [Pyricularia pennisetigena]